MSVKNVINQLQAYPGPDKLTLHTIASEYLLTAVEMSYGVTLPDDFKALYRFSDGFETDEDMFNMIPLDEIRKNRERDKDYPLYIAEYMIYSDMWKLKINPYNCNDYQIINRDEYGEDFVLTNSLDEFISRFLKGGVFDNDGLYDWHDEIRANAPYKPKNLRPLLTVFYNGLTKGIISKEQAISWADNIIMTESEPDNLFIEISLGHDLNGVITAISVIPISDSCLSTRALFGILYLLLLNEVITVDKAFAVIDQSFFTDKLTLVESKNLHDIEYTYFIDDDEFNYTEAREAMLTFLTLYKDFTLKNYSEWAKINKDINIALGPKNAQLELNNNQKQAYALDRAIRSNTRSRLIKIIIATVLIALLGFLVMKFSPGSLPILIIILFINIVRAILEFRKK